MSVKTPERTPFTANEQAAILAAAEGDRLYIIVVLAHATGLRQSELLGIRWPDVDLDYKLLRFGTQLKRDMSLKGPKTAAGKRALPLPDFAARALTAHRANQERERAAAPQWDERGFVISTRTGGPVGHRNAHRSWTRIVKAAGVPHRGIHHMRHAYGTTLAERGVHERVAQYLLGHADSRVTKEIYTHVTGTMLDQAAVAIDQAVTDVAADFGSKNGSRVTNGAPDGGPADREADA